MVRRRPSPTGQDVWREPRRPQARELARRRRCLFARRAWLERAREDAACLPSRLRARSVARDRRGDGGLFAFRLLFVSRSAWRRVRSEVVPFLGRGSRTPARRALDNPMAIACLAERAPCLPSRTCSISSRTNSPAAVEGDLPCLCALRARRMVLASGIGDSSCANTKANHGPRTVRRSSTELCGLRSFSRATA